jgi:hypothetical protein
VGPAGRSRGSVVAPLTARGRRRQVSWICRLDSSGRRPCRCRPGRTGRRSGARASLFNSTPRRAVRCSARTCSIRRPRGVRPDRSNKTPMQASAHLFCVRGRTSSKPCTEYLLRPYNAVHHTRRNIYSISLNVSCFDFLNIYLMHLDIYYYF